MKHPSNWSGSIQFNPKQYVFPSSEGEIQSIVYAAIKQNKQVRIIGSGHSFTPLCKTDQILISLDQYQGLVSVNTELNQATIKAGTKLHVLNTLLLEHGLALPNMGDINVQSLAGAISTGTHGTGISFGNMSTQIAAMTFINGKGERVHCSKTEYPDVLKAAQLSLGSLGVITEITMQCVPAYNLELKIERRNLQDVLEDLEQLNTQNRNFEFYWFLNTPYVMTKTANVTTEKAEKNGIANYLQEMLLENYTFKLFNEISTLFPKQSRRISMLTARSVSKHRKVSSSDQVFSTPRVVKFHEMEYNVPLAAYKEVKKEIINWIGKHNYDIMFPMENRFVKQDDLYLSPAYKRDSAYIAVHTYSKKKYNQYFRAIEEIFIAHDGRPHWGKQHTRTAADLRELYPEFSTFLEIQKQHDPNGVFLSPYLRQLLNAPQQQRTNIESVSVL